MSNDKGIFEPQEGFATPPKSPFSVDDESASNPFASTPEPAGSPFSVADEGEATRLQPESQADNPFASAASKSPFGSEPPAASPFGSAEPSPFGIADSADSADEPAPVSASPFAQVETPKAAEAKEVPAPELTAKPAPAETPAVSSSESDSSSIKQLELRAIFGVDRELTESEILQRAGALPGIRQLSKVPSADIAAIEGIKRVLPSLGFGGGQVKLYCGSAPIDFIREGSNMLAVQTDGGFAPGVRETLMIVARELGRL